MLDAPAVKNHRTPFVSKLKRRQVRDIMWSRCGDSVSKPVCSLKWCLLTDLCGYIFFNYGHAKFGDLILQECQTSKNAKPGFEKLWDPYHIIRKNSGKEIQPSSAALQVFLFCLEFSCWTTGCFVGWYLRRWILVWQAWQGQEPWMKKNRPKDSLAG